MVILTRSEYTPGTPGAQWKRWELLIVRAKLWQLYSNNQGVFNLWNSGTIPNDLPTPMSIKEDLGFFREMPRRSMQPVFFSFDAAITTSEKGVQ